MHTQIPSHLVVVLVKLVDVDLAELVALRVLRHLQDKELWLGSTTFTITSRANRAMC